MRDPDTAMTEMIDFGGLQIRFLQCHETTGGALELFEMTVHPRARMPVAHYHESWEEAVYGLTGTTTWRVDGADIEVGPGGTLFVPRGVVHGFCNDGAAVATCLVILTPGRLGPAYFRELAGLVRGGNPDPASMGAVMRQYGLIPSP